MFLLDDDPGMLKALARLLQAEGFAVQGFTSAKTFLESYRADEPACLVLDVAMPEMNGLELQQHLTREGWALPVVFLTGYGDIPMSVQAIKTGAVDFLTKPVDHTGLLRAVRAALQRCAEQRDFLAETAMLRKRYSSLTPRERAVMEHVVAGQLNKQIAFDLGTSEQTIKVHRGRVMEKMEVVSLADLVRAADRLGLGEHPLWTAAAERDVSTHLAAAGPGRLPY